MKRTWKKALYRLVKKNNALQVSSFPNIYRRLTSVELHDLVGRACAEIDSRLSGVPHSVRSRYTGGCWSNVLMMDIFHYKRV